MIKVWKDEMQGKGIPGRGHSMKKGREVSENVAQGEVGQKMVDVQPRQEHRDSGCFQWKKGGNK